MSQYSTITPYCRCYVQLQLINNIHEPAHIFSTTRTLIDPILTTIDIKVGGAGTIEIESTVSDHKASHFSPVLMYTLNRTYKRKIGMTKTLMLNFLIKESNWPTVLFEASYIYVAAEVLPVIYLNVYASVFQKKENYYCSTQG